jgi:HSP20 family protein
MEKTTELTKGASNLPESPKASYRPVTPAVDIFENDKEYLIVSDMPGVAPEALNIQFDSPTLLIAGEQATSAENQSGELPLSFERSFRMPPTVDADKIRAEVKGGVLRLHLEKIEKSKPTKIEVKKG